MRLKRLAVQTLPVLAVVVDVTSVLGLLLFGAVWYYGSQIHEGAFRPALAPKLDMRVVAVGDGRIELVPTEVAAKDGAWTHDGIWGIEWPGGYARAGRILEMDDSRVVREFSTQWQTPKQGDLVRLDSFAFPHDPLLAFGVEPIKADIKAPLGTFPAWWFEGSRDTWVVFVHGKGADRSEVFRLLDFALPRGFPVLSISYRNDEGVARSRDGRYAYGLTEWPELEAAVQFAGQRGAKRIVLAGNSMGGSIVLSFMRRAPSAGVVAGLILDSPMLNLKSSIDAAGARRHLPQPFTSLVESLAARRYAFRWNSFDYRASVIDPQVAILLFHGTADTTVPVHTSDDFARRSPGRTQYVRVDGATHVRSWNMDPQAYSAALEAFLATIEADTLR